MSPDDDSPELRNGERGRWLLDSRRRIDVMGFRRVVGRPKGMKEGPSSAYCPTGQECIDMYGPPLTEEEAAFGRACYGEARRRGQVTLSPAEIVAFAKTLGYRRVAEPRPPKPPAPGT